MSDVDIISNHCYLFLRVNQNGCSFIKKKVTFFTPLLHNCLATGKIEADSMYYSIFPETKEINLPNI